MIYHKVKKLHNIIRFAMVMSLCCFWLPTQGYPQSQDINMLIQKLNDKDEAIYYRCEAAKALGEAKDRRAVEPLIAALKDEKVAVRAEAATALGKIKDSRAVEPLIGALKDSFLREHAAKALGEIKDVGAVEPLIATLKDERDIVRAAAATALGQIKDSRAVKPLIVALNETTWVHQSIADALGHIGTPVVEALILALKDENLYVRRGAARALGETKDFRANQLLIAALKNNDLEVVAGAYPFFIRRGESGTEAVLTQALKQHGDSRMATDFLNSGNGQLQSAGREWAERWGFKILPIGGGGGLTWGGSQ